MGRSDPAGFAARAARCQMLRESHLVEPGVLIPTFNALNKNASTREALLFRWRRGRDYSEQPVGRSDPSGFPAAAARCQMLLESHLVEPRVLIPLVYSLIKNASTKEALLIRWRRGRDSNPRYVAVYTLSRRAPSTTRPPLRGGGV